MDTEGVLHVVFTDGRDVVVLKERGRFVAAGDTLTQEAFQSIQIDERHQRAGWLASYMICAQSYPCTPELTILDEAQETIYIDPPAGVIWKWAFVDEGEGLVIHYGFPHGDELGSYALYDAKTGIMKAKYTPGRKETPPGWVRERAGAWEAPEGASGHWEGSIQLPTGDLGVKVDLENDGGVWSGTIDIPMQGVTGRALESVSVEGSTVRFSIKGVPGNPTFDGALAAGEIKGNFTQGGAELPFHLDRRAAAPPKRPGGERGRLDPDPRLDPGRVREGTVPGAGEKGAAYVVRPRRREGVLVPSEEVWLGLGLPLGLAGLGGADTLRRRALLEHHCVSAGNQNGPVLPLHGRDHRRLPFGMLGQR